MSVSCEICDQFTDHNIMQHIYELEAHVETLILRLDALSKEVGKLKNKPH